MTSLAYQHLPDEVYKAFDGLASDLIAIVQILCLFGLLTCTIRGFVRYRYGGAGLQDVWLEILGFIVCAGVSVQTFNLANFVNF